MKGIKQFETWRAEEIAKVYLLNSGLVTVLPDYTDYDFLAISKNIPDRKVAIEVKATKYPKGDIKRKFSKTRTKFSKSSLPVIMMYINSDKEMGFFEVLNKNSSSNHLLQPLVSDKLNNELSQLLSAKTDTISNT